jgi:hypothetical protein
MPTILKTSEEFLAVKKKRAILLFSTPKNPPCLVMENLLKEFCRINSIELYIAPTNNLNMYSLIEKYHVGMLPYYILLLNDKVVYANHGTCTRTQIEKEIKNAGVLL